MKALMQARVYREGGARKFSNEPSISLAKIGWIVVPSPYNAVGITRTNLDLHGVNSAKGAVGIEKGQAALTADCVTVAANFMSTFAVTSQ